MGLRDGRVTLNTKTQGKHTKEKSEMQRGRNSNYSKHYYLQLEAFTVSYTRVKSASQGYVHIHLPKFEAIFENKFSYHTLTEMLVY